MSGITAAALLLAASEATAQDTAHQHHQADTASGWTFSQDGLVYALFNHQEGPRGGDEFKVPTGGWACGRIPSGTPGSR